ERRLLRLAAVGPVALDAAERFERPDAPARRADLAAKRRLADVGVAPEVDAAVGRDAAAGHPTARPAGVDCTLVARPVAVARGRRAEEAVRVRARGPGLRLRVRGTRRGRPGARLGDVALPARAAADGARVARGMRAGVARPVA